MVQNKSDFVSVHFWLLFFLHECLFLLCFSAFVSFSWSQRNVNILLLIYAILIVHVTRVFMYIWWRRISKLLPVPNGTIWLIIDIVYDTNTWTLINAWPHILILLFNDRWHLLIFLFSQLVWVLSFFFKIGLNPRRLGQWWDQFSHPDIL